MKKLRQNHLERKQESLEDTCVFLHKGLCKTYREKNPSDCINGDYIMCDLYHTLYKAYVNGYGGENVK